MCGAFWSGFMLTINIKQHRGVQELSPWFMHIFFQKLQWKCLSMTPDNFISGDYLETVKERTLIWWV